MMSYANVLETVDLIRKSPANIGTESDLAGRLSQCPNLGGYDAIFDKPLLSDRLNVDMLKEWGHLANFCRQRGHEQYAMMFFFSPISFRFDSDMSLIRTLLAYGFFDELKNLPVPLWPEYTHFQPDQAPRAEYLLHLMKPFQTTPPEDDRSAIYELMSAKEVRKMREAKSKHAEKANADAKTFADFLVAQWPCAEPSVSGLAETLLLDVASALGAIRPEWLRLFQNKELSDHLRAVQEILKRRYSDNRYTAPTFVPSFNTEPVRVPGGEIPELSISLMRKAGPNTKPFVPVPPKKYAQPPPMGGVQGVELVNHSAKVPRSSSGTLQTQLQRTQVAVVNELYDIIDRLTDTTNAVRRKYGEELRQSNRSFEGQSLNAIRDFSPCATEDTAGYVKDVLDRFDAIRRALETPSSGFLGRRVWWLKQGLLWPAVTASNILEQLRSTANCQFGEGMKEAIIEYGLAITRLQRALRLTQGTIISNPARYREEVSNTGHTNWRPEDYPDWLLLEIESNLLIRPDQVDVALATISPNSGSNSVLQMNMGQGKPTTQRHPVHPSPTRIKLTNSKAKHLVSFRW